jgi:transcriptional regulator with XRE-family HTH domain
MRSTKHSAAALGDGDCATGPAATGSSGRSHPETLGEVRAPGRVTHPDRESKPGGPAIPHVCQQDLAAALGIGNTSVSNWERRTDPAIPGPARLAEIATFHATRRSLGGSRPRLLTDTLTPDEEIAREQLLQELGALHAMATGSIPAAPTWNPWRFPGDAPVRLICGSRPEPAQSATARTENHNFVALRTCQA